MKRKKINFSSDQERPIELSSKSSMCSFIYCVAVKRVQLNDDLYLKSIYSWSFLWYVKYALLHEAVRGSLMRSFKCAVTYHSIGMMMTTCLKRWVIKNENDRTRDVCVFFLVFFLELFHQQHDLLFVFFIDLLKSGILWCHLHHIKRLIYWSFLFFFVFCLNVVLIKTPFLVLYGSTYDSFGFLCSCCCFGLVQTECATSRSVCLIFAFFFCFVYPLRMCLCIWGHYIRIGIEI